MTIAEYPVMVWDGRSENRDPEVAIQASPDWRDWERMVAEIAAVQKSNIGYDPLVARSYGTKGSASGISVLERGNAALHMTIITLTDVLVTTTDGTTPATDGAWGTLPLYVFPKGHLLIHAAHQDYPIGKLIAVTGGGGGLSTTADFELGIGSTARANAANFALQTNEENICAGVDVDLVSKASNAEEASAATASLFLDGSGTAITARLNMVTLDDADHGTSADQLKVSGTITLIWTVFGQDNI